MTEKGIDYCHEVTMVYSGTDKRVYTSYKRNKDMSYERYVFIHLKELIFYLTFNNVVYIMPCLHFI